MRLLLAAFISLRMLYGGGYSATPNPVRQGETLSLTAPPEAHSARFADRTVPLFAQPPDEVFGLGPVPVTWRPGAYSLEWLAADGHVIATTPVSVLDAHYRRQNVVLSKALLDLHATTEEQTEVASFLSHASAERYWHKPLVLPVRGCMTSPFGVRRLHNGKLTADYHAGLDQRGAAGSPVVAVAGGIVKLARQYSLRGGTVAVDHGQGLESMYLHMSEIVVKDGESVEKGGVIGKVGSTGRSTAPHLHWSLYANGVPVNPLQWVHVTPCASPAPRTPHRAPAK